jgi:hypothetical protein
MVVLQVVCRAAGESSLPQVKNRAAGFECSTAQCPRPNNPLQKKRKK